jgi:hypothetical protein
LRKTITPKRDTRGARRLGNAGPMYLVIKKFGIMYVILATRQRGITSLVAFQPHITISIKTGMIRAKMHITPPTAAVTDRRAPSTPPNAVFTMVMVGIPTGP